MSKTPNQSGRAAPHTESDAANLARTGHTGNVGSSADAGDGERSTESDLGKTHSEDGDRRRYAHDGSDHRPRHGGETTINAPEARVEEARDAVKRRQDKLSSQNEEGHARNMQREEESLKERKTVESEDGEIGAPDPKLGREDNGNTPRIAADGSKSWGPPSVAGSVKV